MIDLKNKRIAILGFGMEGKDLANILPMSVDSITVLDKKSETEIDFSDTDKQRIRIICGEDYLKSGLTEFDIIFRSPGVYKHLPEIIEAEKSGVLISSATKLFFDLCPAKIIGVTGTKGKGTTSTLIYQILKESKFDVYLAGNIGSPMLSLIPKLTSTSWVVLELSSFQLIDLTTSPYLSVVLNITTDHLDWHRDRDEYIKSKANIVKHQLKSDYAVINADYKDSKNFQKLTKAQKYYISSKKKVSGVYIEKKQIWLNIESNKENLGNVDDLLLKGAHNWENVNAAICSSYLAGASTQSIRKIIYSFKGLEHRLELVKIIKGVTFYNDSFSTNPQTTIAAVKSFREPMTLILGGFEKKLNYDEMAKVISKSNVVNIILIGDIAQKIKKSLLKSDYRGEISELGYSSMETIVQKSYQITPKDGVVIFSPASSSFDMFKDYKERGGKFKESVINLSSEK